MNYFATYNTYNELNGDETLPNLKNCLSRTEKKTSKIVKVDKYSINTAFGLINSAILLNEDEKFNKIVRIIFENGNIIKLQTYDNGTPFVFVFDKQNAELEYVEPTLETLARRRKVILSKINSP